MDTIKSFKGYGKVKDDEEDREFSRKSRNRYILIGVSVVVLLAIIVGALLGTWVKNDAGKESSPATSASTSTSIKAVCSVTQYTDACLSSLSSVDNPGDPEELFKLSMKVAADEISKLLPLPKTLIARAQDARIREALADCQALFEEAIDQLNSSMELLRPSPEDGAILSGKKIEDLRTWLSAALTYQETCLDGLGDISVEFRNMVASQIKNATQFTSNSLAIATKIITILRQLDISIHRKLLSPEFPTWLSSKDRRLLQAKTLSPDAVVAADGSGNFTRIQDAVDAAPKKNARRFVIYIKAGTYMETVVVDKSKWNVMMVGESQEKTIVSGSLNVIDGTPTFRSATVAVAGRGFMARDVTFINTAGPAKHQAVAFRSSSDRSVFHRCTFDAYQDTLYAHSFRQFYSDCTVRGTIDFVFGNAAAVFQRCLFQPRQPGVSQKNILTAQGKVDANQNTGFSIHICRISPYGNVTAQTFLGRPWKDYSTTVYMLSAIDAVVDPAGWLPWIDNIPPPATIYYAEYQNTGPGSNLTNRVNWAGYKPSISEVEAMKFTVEPFIQASEWVPDSGVTYASGL